MLGNECRGHIQHLSFGLVGVGDKATLKPSARARQVGTTACNHAASATLGRGHAPLLLEKFIGQREAVLLNLWVHQALQSAKHKSVQKAATKSSNKMPNEPRQPKPLNS